MGFSSGLIGGQFKTSAFDLLDVVKDQRPNLQWSPDTDQLSTTHQPSQTGLIEFLVSAMSCKPLLDWSFFKTLQSAEAEVFRTLANSLLLLELLWYSSNYR